MLFPKRHPSGLYGKEQNPDLLPRTLQLGAVCVLNYAVVGGGGHPSPWALGASKGRGGRPAWSPRGTSRPRPRAGPVSLRVRPTEQECGGSTSGRAWQRVSPAQTLTSDPAPSVGGSCGRVCRGHRLPGPPSAPRLRRPGTVSGVKTVPGAPSQRSAPLPAGPVGGAWLGLRGVLEASGLGWDRPGSLESSQRRKPDGLVGSQARPCLSHLRASSTAVRGRAAILLQEARGRSRGHCAHNQHTPGPPIPPALGQRRPHRL